MGIVRILCEFYVTTCSTDLIIRCCIQSFSSYVYLSSLHHIGIILPLCLTFALFLLGEHTTTINNVRTELRLPTIAGVKLKAPDLSRTTKRKCFPHFLWPLLSIFQSFNGCGCTSTAMAPKEKHHGPKIFKNVVIGRITHHHEFSSFSIGHLLMVIGTGGHI